MAKPGRPRRKEQVIKTAWYPTADDIDTLNRIRVELFAKERIQANTNTDILSITIRKYSEMLGIRKAHGRPQG